MLVWVIQRFSGTLNSHVARWCWIAIVEVAEALGIVYNPENVVTVPLLAAVELAGVIPCRRSC